MLLKNCKGVNRELLEKLWQKGGVYLKKFNVKIAPYFGKSDSIAHYPAGARIYTKSRNVIPPIEQKTDIPSFKRKVAEMDCISQEGKSLVVEQNGKRRVVNSFLFEKYSKGNDKKKQD